MLAVSRRLDAAENCLRFENHLHLISNPCLLLVHGGFQPSLVFPVTLDVAELIFRAFTGDEKAQKFLV